MMRFRRIIPPPPTPWMVRPTSRVMKSFATLAMMIPTRKNMVQVVSTTLRPKMSDRAPVGSWKTVELRRKLVPVQNASMAVPCRLFEMT
jgi:hypothetical protein